MKYLSRTVGCLAVLCSLCVFLHAAESESVPGAGMWRRAAGAHACEVACQQQLLSSLQRLTGWQGLHFNEAGKLVVDDLRQYAQGSAEARQLFQRVWQTPDVYWIEDHSRSASVNFGQLNEGLVYDDVINARQCIVWQVRLDFADFAKLQASRAVRSTFDAGFTFMHELLHGLGHQDAHSFEEVGECEEVVNRIRRELALPTRAHYFAEAFNLARGFPSAKLLFKRATPAGKECKEWLFFIPGDQTLTASSSTTTAAAVAARTAVRQR